MSNFNIYKVSKDIYQEDEGFLLESLSYDDLKSILTDIMDFVGYAKDPNVKLSLKDIVEAYTNAYGFYIKDQSIRDIEISIYKFLLCINFPNCMNYGQYQKYSRNFGQIVILYAIFNRTYELYVDDKGNFGLLLPDQELISDMEFSSEFEVFRFHYLRERTYELMKLNQELFNHTSYDHIIGVSLLATEIAKELYKKKIKIDIGVVSGAALSHDIGKYACNEEDNVARIHYYFTDKWCETRKLDYIRNIAVNHSIWDLELENLSVESLVLIISDFMVKKDIHSGKVKILSLEESFGVVMSKLEDLTEAKIERYKRVFNKLKDFECFIKSVGVEVTVSDIILFDSKNTDLTTSDLIKNTAIRHSIEVMHKLRSSESIYKMMKQVIDAKDHEGVLSKLRIIEEYSPYITADQKKSILELIFDLLYNPHEQIRSVSSSITGILIYHFHSNFRKWIPEREKYKYKKDQYERVNLLNSLLLKVQGHYGVISDSKYELLCKSFGVIIGSISECCMIKESEVSSEEDLILLKYIEGLIDGAQEDKKSILIRIELLSSMISKRIFVENSLLKLIDLINVCESQVCKVLKGRGLYLLKEGFINYDNFNISKDELSDILKEVEKENYLMLYLITLIRNTVFHEGYEEKNSMISDLKTKAKNIFLSNLKSTTSTTSKLINIEILEELSYFFESFDTIYFALHLINILRTNHDETIRNKAGKTLCSIIERLDTEMINDIAVELFKSLEGDDYEFDSKIAYYLGYLYTFLPIDEYKEQYSNQIITMKSGGTTKKLLVLDTVSSTLINSSKRLNSIDSVLVSSSMKIMFIGLNDESDSVRHHSFKVLSQGVFKNIFLSNDQKVQIFKAYGKKISNMILGIYRFDDHRDIKLSGDFNILYRFISNCEYLGFDLKFDENLKVALYSGAFDPISKGQKNVINTLIQMGYDVMLQINEFIWNRSLQPYEYRKRMVELAVAEFNNVSLLNSDEIYNLSIKTEVDRLIRDYSHKELCIVIGEDDLLNNATYTVGDKAINSVKHLIVKRGNTKNSDRNIIDERIKSFKVYEIIDLSDDESTSISPMSIRSGVDKKYDLNDYLDERVAKYVKDNYLYNREPNLKGDMANKSIKFILNHEVGYSEILIVERIDNSIIGRIEYEILNSNGAKKIIVKRLNIRSIKNSFDSYMILLSELILSAVNTNVDIISISECYIDSENSWILREMGFKLKESNYVLKINKIAIIILDFYSKLKVGPLTSNRLVEKGIMDYRVKLLNGLSEMLSDRTVIFVKTDQIEGHLLDIIEKKEPEGNMVLCISDLFKKGIVPNFVTENLSISDSYNINKSFLYLEPDEGYLSISSQIGIIKRFYLNLYMIVVYFGDHDIMNELIDKMIDYNLSINEVITFISSDYQKKSLNLKQLIVDSAFDIPDDTIVIKESSMMPFAGGIPVIESMTGITHQNVNSLFPYCERKPFDVEDLAFISFSEQMIKWLIELYALIEREYEKTSGKRLLISELSKVFNQVKYPYVNTNMTFKEDFSIIDFLIEELKKVHRSSKF